MTARTLRVARKAAEAEGICSFELVAADGTPLPDWTAGAHVDVQVPGGPLRQYSLCSDPADRTRWRIAVLREAAGRGGSAALHDRVAEGELIEVGTPRNLFPLVDGAARHLLLAGGIGVTPILAMAQALHAKGADFDFHYATRSAGRTAFAAEIAAAPWAGRACVHHDDGPAAQRLDLAALLAAPAAGRHLYVCGPQGFIDAVLGAARAAGWLESALHWEFFGAAPAPTGDAAFDVVLRSSGRVIRVEPQVTVVQALASAGVDLPVSCEMGICGTCLTRVVDGTPDHRDQYLTPEEQAANDQFTPCCSRSRSARLVLDL